MADYNKYFEDKPGRALDFLQYAYVRRHSQAALRLGEMYRDGNCVNESKRVAQSLFEKGILWAQTQHQALNAVKALNSMNVDRTRMAAAEMGEKIDKQYLPDIERLLVNIPFLSGSYPRINCMIASVANPFREAESFMVAKEQIDKGNIKSFDSNFHALIEAMDSLSKLYPKACHACSTNGIKFKPIDFAELYPFPNIDQLVNMVDNAALMYLSLRTTQDPEIQDFTLLHSDCEFLNTCEECTNDSIQSFMMVLIELKLEIETYFNSLWVLFHKTKYRNFEPLFELFDSINNALPSETTKLTVDHDKIKNSLPKDMFDINEEGNMDDFNRLLDEFFKTQDDDHNSSSKLQVSTKDPINNADFSIQSVAIDYDFNTEDGVAMPLRTYFRQSDGDNLHVDITISNPLFGKECWGFEADVELSSVGGLVWGKKRISELVTIDEHTHIISLSFNNLKLNHGLYNFLFTTGHLCDVRTINIVDLPAPYTACAELLNFSIYRLDDSDQEMMLCDIPENKLSQSCFNAKGLYSIMISMVCSNVLPQCYPYQLVLRIYNQLGVMVVGQTHEDVANESSHEYNYVGFNSILEDFDLGLGTYKVEIELFSEVVVSAEFVIGGKDVKAIFNKYMVQPKTNIAGRKIVRHTEDPMATLNQMVGLEEVKKEIRMLTAKMNIDKKRAMNGLKTSPISLHAAFLGNPGTGKTTVAELLGQIYKDLGVLSSGHVVFEERSTLTGQNWNSECDLTNKAIEKAKGGILFIDEAYDLVTSHPNDPGKLIISTLLTSLSDSTNRDWMLILAGYPIPMEKMLSTNEGFRSRLKIFNFQDYTKDELFQIGDLWIEQNQYVMTERARVAFRAQISLAEAQKDSKFGNARYVRNLLEKQIILAMSTRLVAKSNYDSIDALRTIEFEDIPNAKILDSSSKSINNLNQMVGLRSLKTKIHSHLDFVRFVNLRRDCGINTVTPPLHMIFTGNPGTGKTTVADYLGEIYKSLGLLSVGRVVKVSRADMVGQFVGDTEQKMATLLSASKGNILFIDEAYTLHDGGKEGGDFGKRALEMLLNTLSRESVDMIVIMAGYPKQMQQLLQSNPGLSGRFPYTFDFEDYTPSEMLKIAEGVCLKNNLILSDGAREAIAALIKKQHRTKDAHFSNARLVVRLITTQIMPNMASRLIKTDVLDDQTALKTILAEDVPIASSEVAQINNNLFDEPAIEQALKRLDSLVGLEKVKRALHEFVDLARGMNVQKRKFIGSFPLKWSFAGNSGTGKSTVAEILSEILKGMYLLGKGHLVEVKAEELYAVNTHQADELLKKRMKESQQGLLFVDGDAPQFRSPESRYNPDYLRMCLAANTAEMPGNYAIVIAEHESPRQGMAQGLAQSGITDFDHTLIFDEYTLDQLLEILKLHLLRNSLTLDLQAEATMRSYISRLCDSRRQDFTNARTMKLLARSIHKLSFLSHNPSGVVTASIVAEFASSRPSTSDRKKIGYLEPV